MVIGFLHLSLRIPENQSLKGKRRVLQGLKSRLRQRFNVSVSETGNQDKWQLADLGLACIGTDRMSVNRCLNQVVQFAEKEREAELIDVQMEFL